MVPYREAAAYGLRTFGSGQYPVLYRAKGKCRLLWQERPSLSAVMEFIRSGLKEDVPIAFLNLDHGDEENLESWHWVTIAGLYCSEDGQVVQVFICDEGITKQINLKLWLETTVQGGGLVYFQPDSQQLMEEQHGK